MPLLARALFAAILAATSLPGIAAGFVVSGLGTPTPRLGHHPDRDAEKLHPPVSQGQALAIRHPGGGGSELLRRLVQMSLLT